MSPTGVPLLVLLILLIIALPITAFWVWSRLRPRVWAVLACALLVVATQLSTVGAIAVIANRSGQYYTAWSQLAEIVTGGQPTQGIPSVNTSSQNGTDPQAAGSLTHQSVGSFSTKDEWATSGRLESVTMQGANSGLTSHAFVYLPPEYFQQAFAHTRFPAAEAISGYPGNDRNLVQLFKYPSVLRAEVAAGRARPMVLVMMRPSLNYRRDFECTDVPDGPLPLTFFAQDVPRAMSRRYRVPATGWGVLGDSTGGYCAAKLAMNYPDTFHAAVSLSGYYTALQDNTTGDLWGGSPEIRNLNDLGWRLAHRPAPATSLLVTISKQEKSDLGYDNTRHFMSLAKAPMQVDSIVTPTGGHDLANWTRLIPRTLDWLSGKLPAQEVTR